MQIQKDSSLEPTWKSIILLNYVRYFLSQVPSLLKQFSAIATTIQ